MTSALSESASNIVENVACRVAQQRGGQITPNHLAPYLPMSLGMVKACLDDMLDGTSVVSELRGNVTEYTFAAYRNTKGEAGTLPSKTCVACDTELGGARREGILCPECNALLRKELNVLAEKTGWPAQAVYEHEILYHAAEESGPVPAAKLAGVSRYTLRRMRQKLDRMTIDHFVRQEVDGQAGVMTYVFPSIRYPRREYRRNMDVIRSYPASVMEEVQIKVVKILLSLGLMFLLMLIVAFWGIPFPLLMLLFLIAAPITGFLIWRHRDAPPDE